MYKRLTSGLLALIMILQIIFPIGTFAIEKEPSQGELVKVGELSVDDYPKLDKQTILKINKETARNRRSIQGERGASLFSSPYLPGQTIGDEDKPKYFANVEAKLVTKGLDNKAFDWDRVIGKDQPITLHFRQTSNESPYIPTGVGYDLEITKDGQYKWADGSGNSTELPLYSRSREAYRYDVIIDKRVEEKIKLITKTNKTTPTAPVFKPDGDIHLGNLIFDIELQQLASTKFTSIWNTGVEEGNRPQIKGNFETKDYQGAPTIFDFPKNENIKTVIRLGHLENFVEDEDNEIWAIEDSSLKVTPISVSVKEDTTGLDFKGPDRVAYNGKTFKYEFKYDVVDGGKLTMTEIIPITFDANGGKFASINDENAEQKITKEVEYGKDLTENIETPTKARETFSGWGIKDNSGTITPIADNALKNIKEAKTFHAIWENNELKTDELVVYESFKDGTDYVNDFIPIIDKLKANVKIKGANNQDIDLTAKDKLEILDDNGNAIAENSLKDYLYEKLNEQPNPNGKPTRVETIKGKVTTENGKVQEVNISIKVVKNIYEAKTSAEKPYYVPNDFVKVTLEPTTKAKDPQKTFYYVNPKAYVRIPGADPKGNADNTFTEWQVDKDVTKYDGEEIKANKKYELDKRYKFASETNIVAQYVNDVIPQTGKTEPKDKPNNYVKVTFVPTDKAIETANKIFWVNPTKDVTIPVANPVGKEHFTFKEWKMGAVAQGEVYKPSTPKKFTSETIITATYDEAADIIPYDPVLNPIARPEGYVRVIFDADEGLNLTEDKAYFVKISAKKTLDDIKNAQDYGYPGYEEETGFKFKNWSPENNMEIDRDLVIVAKSEKLDDVIPQTGKVKPNNVPNEYISVTVETTDKATEDKTLIFWVAPNKDVTIPVTNPIGKKVDRTETEAEYTWVFDGWKSDENPSIEWKDIISGQFTKATTITAQYKKDDAKAGDIVVERYSTTESIKGDGDNFINDYLPTEDELKGLIKVVDANGTTQSLTAGDSVKFVIEADKTFDKVIYEKLKEQPNDKSYVRTENISAEITFANGAKKTVEVPIYVYKNIYEGLTLYGKPLEVRSAEAAIGEEYIRVALIPTEKAVNQQIRIFYVRKNAAVIIPGQDPRGRDNYVFTEWRSDKDNLINASIMLRSANIPLEPPVVKDNEKVELGKRMRFDKSTDIKAQYDKKETPKPEAPDKPTPDSPDRPSLPDYRPDRPSYGGGGSTIYVEKPVEKIIKVPDNAYGKEVWYMQGFENEFRPKDGLTRAEAAQILANALLEDGYSFNKDYKISYKDVGDAWYTKAVKIVTEAQVFEGYDDGEFKPQKKITRAEWISTLKRFQKLSDKSGNHMNLRDGHWAMAEVEAAYEAGWLKIYKDGLASFKEDEIISREEVAAVSNKAFDRVLDKTYIKRNEKSLVTYKDVDEKMWSYEDILCASNTFLFKDKVYRAHWVSRDKNIFNIETNGFEIVQDKFQRDPR